MKISITRKFTFEAAHHLPSHPGKCADVHGHSYKLYVTLSVPEDTHTTIGYSIDFCEMKEIVNDYVINRLDHKDLNDCSAFRGEATSAENIAKWIWAALDGSFRNQDIQLQRITLYETEDCHVTIRR